MKKPPQNYVLRRLLLGGPYGTIHEPFFAGFEENFDIILHLV